MLLRTGSLLDAPAPTGVLLAFRDPFPLLVPTPSSVSEWDRESLSVERLLRLLDLVLVDGARLPVKRTLKSKNDSFPKVFGRFAPLSDLLLASSTVLGRLPDPVPALGVDSLFPGEGGGARVG